MLTTRFAGKTVLVTGASRGIGRAVAERFAAEGARVAINHHGDEAEANQAAASLADDGHLVFDVDVADVSASQAMVSDCIAAFGRLDILINNAGILPAETTGGRHDANDFQRVLAVNLQAAAALSAAVITHFLSRPGGGVIINTSSVHGIIPKPGYAAYAASKGGLDALTRTLALEYADRGIRVNAVAPGAVTTSMNNAWRHDAAKRKIIADHIPLGRPASAADIAGVYTFLASHDANYITGQIIQACGGLTLHADFQRNWSS